MSGASDITPSPPKLRQLLALLTLNANNIVTIDQIVEELWEEAPPKSVKTTLHTYIYQLRRLLPIDSADNAPPSDGGTWPTMTSTLATSANGYALRLPRRAVDVHHFATLVSKAQTQEAAGELEGAAATFRSALGMWRGRSLSDVRCGPLLQAECVRLQENYRSVLDRRIDVELRLGLHNELIGELSSLVTADPIHENLQGKLMLACYRAGRRSTALQVYQRARINLDRELGLEPSMELQALHRAILSGDQSLNLDAPASTGPEVTGPRFDQSRQLPPARPFFHGRERETAAITEVLRSGESAVPGAVVVTGPPGAGKSTLVVQAAHQVRDLYPDGQLYAAMSTADGRPVDTNTVLGGFLNAFGLSEDQLPRMFDERLQMYRSWTTDRRVLVVLEDVPSTTALEHVLPTGSGCATLLTSRRRLVSPSIVLPVPVGPLGSGYGLRMLGTIVGEERVEAERAAAEDLVRLCGSMPGLVRAAGDRLTKHPHWTIEHLVERMRAVPAVVLRGQEGGTGYQASVEHSYHLLSEWAQRAFLAAAACEQPTAAAELAAVLGSDREVAEELLEELADFQLVTVERATDMGIHRDLGFRMAEPTRSVAAMLAEHSVRPIKDDPPCGVRPVLRSATQTA
ncbi:BTAD domain-containing putative transcriptional regulator [Amycolatopsis japonica]